jgi:hypothetical protein
MPKERFRRVMPPWEHPVPKFLYKYLAPDCLHVLTDCRVRFSQRHIFPDQNELRPDVAAFGTEQQIRAYVETQRNWLDGQEWLRELVIRHIIESPAEQQRVSAIAQGAMKSPDEFGIFCMSEAADSARMWTEYAAIDTGFAICFDTGSAAFVSLKEPGKLGKVEYSDDPLGTFLGLIEEEGAGIFFRKRMQYAFEQEWRTVRRLIRLDEQEQGVFLSEFNPLCIRELLIRPGSAVECELRDLIRNDHRYRHVELIAVRQVR